MLLAFTEESLQFIFTDKILKVKKLEVSLLLLGFVAVWSQVGLILLVAGTCKWDLLERRFRTSTDA